MEKRNLTQKLQDTVNDLILAWCDNGINDSNLKNRFNLL